MKLKLSEIIKKMAVLDEIENPTKEDEKRLEELRAEFDKYMELPTSSPLILGSNDNPEGEVRLYNIDTLEEYRNYIRSQDKQADLSEPPLNVGKYVMGLVSGNWKGREPERRAVLTSTQAGGGWLLSEQISAEIITKALAKSQTFVAGAHSVPQTTKVLIIPRIKTMPTAIWKLESAEYDGGDTMEFEGIEMEAKTLMAMVKASIEVVEDAIELERNIENALTTSISQALDLAILLGNGGNEPQGIIGTIGVLEEDLAFADIVDYDFLSNAYFKIENCNERATALIAPSEMYKSLDLLKNTNGDRLLPPLSYEGTQTLPSYKKLSSNQLINDGLMGDYKKVIVGFRSDNMQIETTTKGGSAFAKLETWIRVYFRVSVGISRPAAFCHIKNFGEIAS